MRKRMLLFWDRHVMALETLVCHNQDHNDPFDRTMIARAKADGLKFVTHDYKISFMKNPAFCLYKFLHNKCLCLENVFIVKIYFAI
ncbi:hypothetical protein C823_004153 [Eubacterium plexicaudatum ASF492]|nr:hypothetical protein C823_004153 [Eubacterium plexicaudatum ASF492]